MTNYPLDVLFTASIEAIAEKYAHNGLSRQAIAGSLQALTYFYQATSQPCQICGTPLLIGIGHYSKNRLFCSNRCKVRAYRTRKQQQRHLVEQRVLTELLSQEGTVVNQS